MQQMFKIIHILAASRPAPVCEEKHPRWGKQIAEQAVAEPHLWGDTP